MKYGILLFAIISVTHGNLIENGSFENGNSAFSSNFIYSPGNIAPAGTYDIVLNPADSHYNSASYTDHTGGGYMLALNGSVENDDIVWSQTIQVQKYTFYQLSYWLSSWSSLNSPSIVFDVKINQDTFIRNCNVPSIGGVWEYWSTIWYSGNSETATIDFINTSIEGYGYDFALDDICFVPEPTIRDGIDVDFVTIGNAGNPDDDPHVGIAFGGVDYIYQIGRYEITNAQWNLFVSAVGAPTGNLVSAYNEGVTWTASNLPVNGVSWYEAIQFCNYLTTGDKSQGAYLWSGDNTNPGDFVGVDRETAIETYGIVYVLPTEDEWYKAAYYTGSGYSYYANGTSITPVAGVDSNYMSNKPWDVTFGTQEQNGTYNMMGNVWEWNESPINNNRRLQGGSYAWWNDFYLSSYDFGNDYPFTERPDIGFRIAYVTAPCAYLLIGDLNDDCKVDIVDFAEMASNWLVDCNVTPENINCVEK